MTIKEVAQRTGLTHQAIYKRLKSRGVKIEDLKDKSTGQLTPEGEAIVLDLFPDPVMDEKTEEPQAGDADQADATSVAELTTRVAELTTEVEKLRNQVATLEDERNFLRQTLEREQQLHGIALSKLPAVQNLPPGDADKGKFRSWWDRIRKKD